jgi:hypothetical protein
VDDASSSLDHIVERKDFIAANHMMMCRFKGSGDDGYIKAKGAISKCVEEIQYRTERERRGMCKAIALSFGTGLNVVIALNQAQKLLLRGRCTKTFSCDRC